MQVEIARTRNASAKSVWNPYNESWIKYDVEDGLRMKSRAAAGSSARSITAVRVRTKLNAKDFRSTTPTALTYIIDLMEAYRTHHRCNHEHDRHYYHRGILAGLPRLVHSEHDVQYDTVQHQEDA